MNAAARKSAEAQRSLDTARATLTTHARVLVVHKQAIDREAMHRAAEVNRLKAALATEVAELEARMHAAEITRSAELEARIHADVDGAMVREIRDLDRKISVQLDRIETDARGLDRALAVTIRKSLAPRTKRLQPVRDEKGRVTEIIITEVDERGEPVGDVCIVRRIERDRNFRIVGTVDSVVPLEDEDEA